MDFSVVWQYGQRYGSVLTGIAMQSDATGSLRSIGSFPWGSASRVGRLLRFFRNSKRLRFTEICT